MKNFTLHTDGGSRGNPGPAGIGGVISDSNGEFLVEFKKYIGVATNNIAEYMALIEGLRLAIDNEIKALDCYLDSELIVKQLNGQYKVKDSNMKLLFAKVTELLSNFDSVKFEHVRRENNKEADRLVNEALDEELEG